MWGMTESSGGLFNECMELKVIITTVFLWILMKLGMHDQYQMWMLPMYFCELVYNPQTCVNLDTHRDYFFRLADTIVIFLQQYVQSYSVSKN